LREFQRIYTTINIEPQIEIQENAVPDNLKIVLYRIIQEALNNVAKHSRADRVRVSLKNTGETLTLTIEDNGEGFNQDTSPAVAAVQGGLGIISMRERAAFSGGFFNITSVKGQGTIITVSWP
jgi:signal transduction histidine kinase